MASPMLAATSFSFTAELRAARRTPAEVLCGVVDDGVVDVLEVDAGQCLRTFPDPDPAEVAALRAALERRGARVAVVGIHLDDFCSPTRRRTGDERLEFLVPQLAAANALGAQGVRLPLGQAGPALLDRLVPLLHELDLVLYEEMQGPQLPSAAAHIADRADPRLRLLLDTSVVTPVLPATYLERLRDSAVPGGVVELVERDWRSPSTASAVATCLAEGAVPPSALALYMTMVVRFGRLQVADLAGLLPLVGAVHLKVWDLADDDGRVSEPLRDLVTALVRAGFDGMLCSEWGGHDWLAVDATRLTRRHLALVRSALGDAGVPT